MDDGAWGHSMPRQNLRQFFTTTRPFFLFYFFLFCEVCARICLVDPDENACRVLWQVWVEEMSVFTL